MMRRLYDLGVHVVVNHGHISMQERGPCDLMLPAEEHSHYPTWASHERRGTSRRGPQTTTRRCPDLQSYAPCDRGEPDLSELPRCVPRWDLAGGGSLHRSETESVDADAPAFLADRERECEALACLRASIHHTGAAMGARVAPRRVARCRRRHPRQVVRRTTRPVLGMNDFARVTPPGAIVASKSTRSIFILASHSRDGTGFGAAPTG
jgi:hypothetical protein